VVIARPSALPSGEALLTATGTPPLAVYRKVVPLVLGAGGADALRVDAATTVLEGRFALLDFDAPAAAASAPSAGVFIVTLDAPRQVHRVLLAGARTNHRASLLRLDGNRQAPPTASARNGDAFPGPPADFTDRRFGLRIDDPAGAPETAAPASAFNRVVLRSRPSRARLGLSAPGQEGAAVTFWSAPVAASPPDELTLTGAGAAFAAALQAYLDGLGAPPGASVSVSLVAESDAPCRLTLTAVAAGYRLVRKTFAGPHAGEPKAVLAFPAGSVGSAGVTVALPAGADVASATLGTSESLPSAGPSSGDWTARASDLQGVTSGVRIAPGQPAAARLTTAGGLRVSGVAVGVLALEAPAEVLIGLVADRGGEPAGPLVAEGTVTLTAAGPSSARGRRAWVVAPLDDVPLPAGAAVWVSVGAVRSPLIWLSSDGPPTTPVRTHDGTALDGLAVLADLLAVAPAAASAGTLALAVGDAPVTAPPPVGGARSFDIAAALRLSSGGEVPLTFRAMGPGNVTVYPPVIEYEILLSGTF
jgi:hypothetical protein